MTNKMVEKDERTTFIENFSKELVKNHLYYVCNHIYYCFYNSDYFKKVLEFCNKKGYTNH